MFSCKSVCVCNPHCETAWAAGRVKGLGMDGWDGVLGRRVCGMGETGFGQVGEIGWYARGRVGRAG